ncbi:hypothetical protein ABVK25_004722 [Lepraria finkii]|uniref:Uncharacterized protein n=1 Tax=Lepraria finkii TaxID=1340010 RepID=A0ABR4BB68_9LECA
MPGKICRRRVRLAHLSAPNDPLSSVIITTVASESVTLNNRIKTERLFSFKELTCKRYGEFAIRENLMLLSILSHSATFREAAETCDDADWSTLVEYIGDMPTLAAERTLMTIKRNYRAAVATLNTMKRGYTAEMAACLTLYSPSCLQV